MVVPSAAACGPDREAEASGADSPMPRSLQCLDDSASEIESAIFDERLFFETRQCFTPA
jgi:hypothetical protein